MRLQATIQYLLLFAVRGRTDGDVQPSNASDVFPSTTYRNTSSSGALSTTLQPSSSQAVGNIGSYVLQGIGISGTSDGTADSSSLNASNSASTTFTPSYPDDIYAVITTSSIVFYNQSLRPTGDGPAYAIQCDALWKSWSASSISRSFTFVNTTLWATNTNWTGQLTTLGGCDTHTRLIGSFTPTASSSFLTYSETLFEASLGPQPTCTVQPSDCNKLWDVYMANTAAAQTNITLASSATAITIGNATTSFTNPQSTLPVLTINGTAFSGIVETTAYTVYLPSTTSTNTPSIIENTVYDLGPNGNLTAGTPMTWHNTAYLTATEPACHPTHGVCGPCTIFGGQVQLLYFPVAANVSRNMCATSPPPPSLCPLGSTTAPYTSGLFAEGWNCQSYGHCHYAEGNMSTMNSGPYAVFNGTTLYHNRAYISLSTVYASDQCGTVGTPHVGSVLTLASSQIFSYDRQLIPEVCGDYGYSFNFANLLPNLPYSAFRDWPGDKPGCSTPASGFPLPGGFVDGSAVLPGGLCSTIIDDMYFPVLVVPTEIRNLDPAWATCGVALEGLYDPPKALTAATTLDGLLGPYVITTSTASPASTVYAPGPSATTTISRTVAQDPSSSANQPSSVVPLPDTIQTLTSTLDSQLSAMASSSTPSSDGPSPSYADSSSDEYATVSFVTSSKPFSSDGSSSQYTSTPSTAASEDTNVGAAVASILASDPQTYEPGQYGTSSTSAKDPGVVVASILADGGSTSHATDSTSTIVEDTPLDPLVFTAGEQVYSVTNAPGLSGVFAVDGISITAGASAQQINGHEISALPLGVVVDGTTVTPAAVGASTLEIIQSTRTGSDSRSTLEAIVDGSITIRPGSDAVQDGHTYSLGPSGVVVDGTATYIVPDSPISGEIPFTAESQTLTAKPISGATAVYVIDSTTVSATGSVIKVDGVTLTVQSSSLVVNESQASSTWTASSQSGDPQTAQTSASVNASSGRLMIGGGAKLLLLVTALITFAREVYEQ
ncbi:hypothetical protein LTR15_009561 [Elasticomyces elasticus]|nr:hypothetical protein LTR15_009561 [Elasticomyces elasticus]